MFNYGSIKKKEKQLWSYGNKEIGFQIGPQPKLQINQHVLA